MSSTFITKKCPACGEVYSRENYAGRPSKDNRTKYGCPIMQCKKCGNSFIDTDYREPALNGFREVDEMKVSPATVFYTVVALIIAVMSYCAGYTIGGILIAAASLWLFVDELCGFKKRQERNKELLAESQERIKNPSYLLILKKMGYDVPDSALQKAFDSLQNESRESTTCTSEEKCIKPKPENKPVYEIDKLHIFWEANSDIMSRETYLAIIDMLNEGYAEDIKHNVICGKWDYLENENSITAHNKLNTFVYHDEYETSETVNRFEKYSNASIDFEWEAPDEDFPIPCEGMHVLGNERHGEKGGLSYSCGGSRAYLLKNPYGIDGIWMFSKEYNSWR